MMLWLAVAALTIASLCVLAAPLLRRADARATREAHALEVFRDQLAETQREVERGLLSAAEAAAARTEIERRMLSLGPAAGHRDGELDCAGRPRLVAGIVAGAVPAAGLALYLALGSPQMPGQPLASRGDAAAAMAQAHQIESMVAQLARRLQTEPGDLEGWLMLARSYAFLDRHEDSAESYRRAVGLSQGDPDVVGAYGETLVLANRGTIVPQAREAFEAVRARRPTDPRARFYLALAQDQAGDSQAALEQLVRLSADFPAEEPWQEAVRARTTALAARLGVDLGKVAPPHATAGGFAPMPAGSEALMSMPAAEREAFMRDRVDALAARLAQEPGDVEGWLRLARSYAVLGETDKARAAIDAATREAARGPSELRATVQATARQLGLGGAAPPTATPTGHPDVAPRAAAAPVDVDALRRLGRSHAARGEAAQARDAFARAVALRPNDLALLAELGEAIVAAGGGDAVPPEAVTIYERILARNPSNTEALWYLGVASTLAGDAEAADGFWTRLLAQVPSGSPGRAEIEARIAALRGETPKR